MEPLKTLPKYLYRFRCRDFSTVAGADKVMNGSTGPRLEVFKYRVVGETPCGYWITWALGGKDRWVSKSSKKRFAHPSVEEALEAFIRRKESQIRHTKNHLARAERERDLAIREKESNGWPQS